MQKTEHVARLLHLSKTGKVVCVLTMLLIVTIPSARAGQPVVIPAMADYLPLPPASATVTTSLQSVSNSAALNFKNPPVLTPTQEKETVAEVPLESRLEKRAKAGALDSLQLVRENRISASGSNVSFSVQAGYGRIWGEKSMLQKISDGHQETGCAYVSANFSF